MYKKMRKMRKQRQRESTLRDPSLESRNRSASVSGSNAVPYTVAQVLREHIKKFDSFVFFGCPLGLASRNRSASASGLNAVPCTVAQF